MIELLISACLIAGTRCEDFSLLYDPYQVPLMTCIVAGQAEVAAWQTQNPEWRVERWECGMQDLHAAVDT